MYTIINDLNLQPKHVGNNSRITSSHHHSVSGSSLILASALKQHEEYSPKRIEPSPLICQIYPLGTFMELAPLIMTNLDGVLPVVDVRIEGDTAKVLRPTHYDDLHGFLKQNKRFSEVQASLYFKQIMTIILTAHRHDIVLRDLKLKKFVFTDSSRSTLSLSSLEDAVKLPSNTTRQTPPHYDEDLMKDVAWNTSDANDLFDSRFGCPAYVAPEMLQPGLYSGRCADMWSAGVILYTLLVGYYPFFDTNPQQLFHKIQSGYYHIPPTVSLLAKTLISSLLSYDPSQRPSPYTILHHPWLANVSLVEEVPLYHVRIDLDQTVPTNKTV